ncbi:MAG: tRNA (adenosine(37)-N6)-threonylcarbamoyltransferase complex ATPase subunit type 1 TsaE [Bacteroidales bacterium]|nr:tRNA (adenosine(37)-N6)-threonylcarbamoyltransferase complex ATPase subunit type 1 TsaE [Bacteroidales bacterium]MCF6343029.1 tRNA (adenosine(37)-N6)-threonylcarbamoyltransferase complex ATPase subunit type 1 TsaE [Bacteroidales bacterium]
MKKKTARTPKELLPLARNILSDNKDDRIFALAGKMGAGKTTLIKSFCKALGVKETVSSPTFSLVNEYETGSGQPVFHFDFYRIIKIEEVFDIGYEEYFFGGEYCFVEWPEMVLELLPESYVYVSIEVNENDERVIAWKTVRN